MLCASPRKSHFKTLFLRVQLCPLPQSPAQHLSSIVRDESFNMMSLSDRYVDFCRLSSLPAREKVLTRDINLQISSVRLLATLNLELELRQNYLVKLK